MHKINARGRRGCLHLRLGSVGLTVFRDHKGVTTTVGDAYVGMITCRPLRANGLQLYHPHINEAREIFAAPAAVMWRRRYSPTSDAPAVRKNLCFLLFRLAPIIYNSKFGICPQSPLSPVARRVPFTWVFVLARSCPF